MRLFFLILEENAYSVDLFKITKTEENPKAAVFNTAIYKSQTIFPSKKLVSEKEICC